MEPDSEKECARYEAVIRSLGGQCLHAKELGFAFKRNGAYVLCFDKADEPVLKKLLELDGGIVDMPAVIRHLHEKQDVDSLLEVGVRSYETSRVSAR